MTTEIKEICSTCEDFEGLIGSRECAEGLKHCCSKIQSITGLTSEEIAIILKTNK